MNVQDHVGRLRTAVAPVLGVAAIPELGHSDPMSLRDAVSAYAVGAVEAQPGWPAVRDMTWRIPVTLYYGKTMGQGETAAAVRTKLSEIVTACLSWTSWAGACNGLWDVKVVEGPTVGMADEFQAWIEQNGQNWVAGHCSVDLYVITGLNG